MNDNMTSAQPLSRKIEDFPRSKARTLRFTCGAPRRPTVVGDGSRAFFLRSSGPEDLVNSLWISELTRGGEHREMLVADPRALSHGDADDNVPAEEKARRERAREGGQGIVSYSVDDAGTRAVFTVFGRLFLCEIPEGAGEQDPGASGAIRTRELAGSYFGGDGGPDDQYGPILNPRLSPDGRHVLYTTGEHLNLVDIAHWDDWSKARSTPESPEPSERMDDDGCGSRHHAPREPEPVDDRITTVWAVCGDDSDRENTWRIGLAEFVAGEEMDRYDGFWWSPDSRQVIFETYDAEPEPVWFISDPANPGNGPSRRRYPRALTRNADVHMSFANLEFDEHDRYIGLDVQQISWNRKDYEYVAAVSWTAGQEPLLLVQNRRQTKDQVLRVETDGGLKGRTQVVEEHANAQWLDLVAGTPAATARGGIVCAMNDMDTDTNRLTLDGVAFTPAGWQVRQVLDVGDSGVLAVVQRSPRSDGDPAVPDAWADDAGEHDARSMDVVEFDYHGAITPISTKPGIWTAVRSGAGMVLSGSTMDEPHGVMLHMNSSCAARIDSRAARPGFTPNTAFVRLGAHRLYTAITKPSAESPYAHADSLPVLLKPYGGPGFQQVVFSQSYYWDSQWWADQGFLVVTVDGRGTTGRGPAWDRAIFERMKSVTLADQIEAVHALPEVAPQADLDRVAIIGWSYGGFLSALAVLDAPDTIHAACAGAPPTDWTLYDTHYTERYLGLDPAVYHENGIIQDAAKLRRPLMLIHGFADDNVSIANSLRLSQALTQEGRPHTFLPLTGITHMTNDETIAQRLLTLQRDFLYEALRIRH